MLKKDHRSSKRSESVSAETCRRGVPSSGLLREVELIDHAQRDGTATRLAVVHLPLNEEGLHPL